MPANTSRRAARSRAGGDQRAVLERVAELERLLAAQDQRLTTQRTELEGRLAAQQERLVAQEAAIERLRADAASAAPLIMRPAPRGRRDATEHTPEASNGRRGSRRALLKFGGAAAAAGVAAGAIELWRPASARAAGAHTAMPTVPGVFTNSGAGNAAVTATGGFGALGVDGSSDSAPGVQGYSSSAPGVRGDSTGYYGVYAHSIGASGLFAQGAFYGASLQGNLAPLFLQPQTGVGAPGSGIHSAGEVLIDSNGNMFVCEVGGTPGAWQRLSGVQFGYPGGAVNLLPVPIRLLDTRAGAPIGFALPGKPIGYHSTLQMQASKLTFQSETIPDGAAAVFGNLTVALAPGVDPGDGSSLICWPNGQTRPAAVNVVFNPGDLKGEYTSTFTLVAIGASNLVNIYNQPINPNVAVDVIFDAFGFVM